MKRVSVLALLVLVLAVGALPAAAIIGGELDGEGHPNVGLMIADIDGEPQWRCTGTLIAPRVFLTAGHCVGDGATGARVWFDSDMLSNEEYPYGGETSIEGTPIPHPDYAWVWPDPHDVGVVILDEPVDLDLVALPDPDLLGRLKKDRILEGGYEEGVNFRLVGYGVDRLSWPPPVLSSGSDEGVDRLRKVTESEYISMTKIYLQLSKKAVFDESGSCFGDSGGPVFWLDPDGNEVLVAVSSATDAQCAATGFNYRVDIPEIQDWIYDQFPGD
jgi:hypothetical protein